MSARLRIFHSATELPDPDLPAAPGAPPVACVVVADVLRCTTTLVRAFAMGARSARVFASLDLARAAHATTAGAARPLLCGEGLGLKPLDFDLGNSPREFTAARVAGRDLFVATTNGAVGIARAPRGAVVLAAAFTNLSRVAARIEQLVRGRECEAWFVGAGQSGAPSPEDDRMIATLAHLLVARGVLQGNAPAPAPLAPGEDLVAFLGGTPHGRGLVAADPTFAADFPVAAAVDSESVVPEGVGGLLHKGPDRGPRAG